MTSLLSVNADEGVVYYVRRGDRVKIGQTVRLAARRRELQVKEFAAVEPGDRSAEKARHAEFAHLNVDPGRANSEWFRLESDLQMHIEQLRATYALPELPEYLTRSGRFTASLSQWSNLPMPRRA
jgi:hypothetical protein